MSMYRQMWLAVVSSMLLALAGALLASVLSARDYLESQLSLKNADNAAALALTLSRGDQDLVSVELATSALFDSGHYESIRVVDGKGKTLVEKQSRAGETRTPAWFVSALPIRSVPGQAQISNGWQPLGTVTLVSHSRFAYEALWSSVLRMTAALAAAGLIAGLLGSFIVRRLKVPLDAVIGQARAISERRFVTIPEPDVPELRHLAAAMNGMVKRLKATFDEEAARLEQLRREANLDPLTGLANRAHFLARLEHALAAEDVGGGLLLLVRLAELAEVNRRLGRAAADEYVGRAGAAIDVWAQQRHEGAAARLNGSDFAVMLLGETDGEAAAVSLLRALGEAGSAYVGGRRAASVGFGLFGHGMDLDALLARVDLALAQAEGRADEPYGEAPVDDGQGHPHTAAQWSRLIRRALDRQQVRLGSFPVVDMAGVLSHRECPLRLMLDDAASGEWLPAGQFMPVAERLGMTTTLDLIAVSLGLDTLRAEPALPGLGINLAAGSVADAPFRKQLLALLGRRRPEAKRLWIDITETGAFRHPAMFRELCRGLKGIGCRVGLEHVGHQFSRIGTLHDLGIDYLKVDASFVRRVDQTPGNAAFLKGLCSIAHTMGLEVLAEGVETPAELIAIRELGFDGATGPAVAQEATEG